MILVYLQGEQGHSEHAATGGALCSLGLSQFEDSEGAGLQARIRKGEEMLVQYHKVPYS